MESKEYASKYLTATEILSNTACELSQLLILSSNATSDLKVYDGVDTNGELKLRIRGPASQSKPYPFNPHIYFRRGLYVEFVQKVDGCFIQWKQRPQIEG